MVKIEDTSKYKVNFYRGLTENDRAYSQTAKVNEALVLKFPMNKTGYTFAGWYTDAEFTNFYDVSVPKTEPGDIDLYARWVKAEEAATLTVKGATLVNEKVNGTGAGVIGETFHEPTVVLKDGDTVEWYADAAFTTPFDFTKTIESAGAVTIYAKIVKAGTSSEETSSTVTTPEETTTTLPAESETTSATENTENTTEDTQPADSESGMPVGVIVVIVAAVLIAVLAVVFVVMKKKK